MYEERRNFSVRDIVLQVLFVALFIFVLMWLFPSKSFVTNYVDGAIEDAIKETLDNYEFGGGINSEAFANQLFNQNVMMIKSAAKDYYTLSRLPQNDGDVVKITLKEMLEEKILLPFVDSKGNTCDTEASYVTVTKKDKEYLMKINLKCSDYEDYLLVHMGCYDYCSTTLCETNKPTTKDPVIPDTPDTPTPTVYEYEYQLVIDGRWGEFGEWSEWTKNIISENEYRKVETKTEKEKIGEKSEQVQVGTKEEQVQVGTKEEQVQVGTKSVQVQTGTKQEQVQVGTKSVQVQTGTKSVQVQTGAKSVQVQTGTRTVPVYTTITIPVYKTVNSTVLDCSSNCKYVTKTTQVQTGTTTKTVQTGTRTEPVYDTRTVPVYETKTEPVYDTRTVPVYETKTVPVYETKTVPVYETKTVPVYETKTVPVYETKTVPVYETVTYYRSRTKTYISGSMDYKWSRSQNDISLIKQGYTLTGKSREA